VYCMCDHAAVQAKVAERNGDYWRIIGELEQEIPPAWIARAAKLKAKKENVHYSIINTTYKHDFVYYNTIDTTRLNMILVIVVAAVMVHVSLITPTNTSTTTEHIKHSVHTTAAYVSVVVLEHVFISYTAQFELDTDALYIVLLCCPGCIVYQATQALKAGAKSAVARGNSYNQYFIPHQPVSYTHNCKF
jgi:hypothetical protein